MANQMLPWGNMAGDDTGNKGSGGGVRRIKTATVSTGSIANNAVSNTTIALANTYQMLAITTNVPARVRAYKDEQSRTDDAARIIGVDPAEGAGCLLEVVTADGLLELPLSPVVDGWIETGGKNVPVAIQNLSGGNADVTVQVVWLS